MTLEKSLISANNNQQIRTFLDEGSHINHAPISVYGVLQATNLAANQNYTFSLKNYGYDIVPITMIASSNSAIIANQNFYIEILESLNSTPLWTFNIAGRKNLLGNVFSFDFMESAVNKNYIVQIRSDVALTKVNMYFRKCFIETPIKPD